MTQWPHLMQLSKKHLRARVVYRSIFRYFSANSGWIIVIDLIYALPLCVTSYRELHNSHIDYFETNA